MRTATPHRPPLARWALLALLLATTCLFPAQAAPKRVALLIGNSHYQFESTLANPVRDVRLLAQSLRGLGFKAEVLENLPKREMDLAIKRFVRDSAGADTALLYYAGHGQQPSKGGRSFLLPVNANAVDDDQLEADGVPAEDIAAQLERLPNPARLRLVVLDACRNTRAVNRSTVRGLAPPARTDSFTLIAYSTDANAVAQDGAGQNSPYAQALANHLPGLASKPVRQVFEDTAREVRQATRQQQWPRTYGDLESRIGLDGVELVSLPTVAPKPDGPRGEEGMVRVESMFKEARKLPPCPASTEPKSWLWSDCFGRVDMGGGEGYEGVLKNGLFDVVGKYTWAKSGSYYIGEWRDGRRHGYGLLVSRGNETFDAAANFDKPWSLNAPSSMLVNQDSGDSYEGEWRFNRRNGVGKYTFKNGDVYTGDFVNDRFNGRGTLVRSGGGQSQSGMWSNNEFFRSTTSTASIQTASSSNSALIDGRYQVQGDGSEVKDVQTGLVWARCSVGQRWDGKTCAGEAKAFTFIDAQKQAGKGWRLPTARELASLIYCSSGKTKDRDDPDDGGGSIPNHCEGKYAEPTIRIQIFPNTPLPWSLSSSPDRRNAGVAWGVNFNIGALGTGGLGQIRLVRTSK